MSRLRFRAHQTWTPLGLGASLLGWWDASRYDLITESGGLVSSWKDVVAGYDVTQATALARPGYTGIAFNGRPGLVFDGLNDCLALESVPFPTVAAACEIWGLVQQDSLVADTGQRFVASYGGNSSNTSRSVRRIVTTGVNRLRAQGGTGAASVNADQGTVDFSGRHVVRSQVTGSAVIAAIDGVASSSSALVPNTGTTRTRIGASTATTADSFWFGVIAVVIVTSALTVQQAQNLQGYLTARGV